MISLETAAAVAAILVCIVIIWEIAVPHTIKETFSNYVSPVSIKSIYGQLVPARGDVGDEAEEEGYRADPRYFHGYREIQRLGLNKDYCRMVEPVGGAKDGRDAFFACALAGTEGLSSVAYRTQSVRNGFKRSRDDYMRDIANEGRDSYCSIIRVGGEFQPRCYRPYDTSFGKSHVIDSSPPDNIRRLLSFYDGAMIWYRMRDDMLDYTTNTFASLAVGMAIEEKPAALTRGLSFNGIDQFIRIGTAGSGDLALTEVTPMRFARAFSMWVRFDEFTNNAHVFDFGNGPGKDNVFLGIIGRGNIGVAVDDSGKGCNDQATNTVPKGCGNGTAVLVDEVHPRELLKCGGTLMEATSCLNPETTITNDGIESDAHLLYEVWDQSQRVMRCIVPNSIRRGVWTHITITALNMDVARPQVGIYVNGVKKYVEMNGFLPQTSYMTHNYIGKSNWASDGDELFKGSLFDFRVYTKNMGEKKIKDTVAWGSELLGLSGNTP
jgi:hypothetical protein